MHVSIKISVSNEIGKSFQKGLLLLHEKFLTFSKSFLLFTANVLYFFLSDFDKIQAGLKKRPTLEGRNISIKTVPVNKTILVKNLPASATYDSVLYKFENKRTGGGEIERVDLDLEKRIALIEFTDGSGRTNSNSINIYQGSTNVPKK